MKKEFNIRAGFTIENSFLHLVKGELLERNGRVFFVHHFLDFKIDEDGNKTPVELNRWMISDLVSGCGVLLPFKRFKSRTAAIAELDKMIAEKENYLKLITDMSEKTVKRFGPANK